MPFDPSAVAAARQGLSDPPNVTSPAPKASKAKAKPKASPASPVTPGLFSKPPSARSTYNTTRTSRSAAYDSGPASRAAADAARKQMQKERRDPTPGPGAYDPKPIAKKASKLAGSSAFNSKTDRSKTMALANMSDPGLYSPLYTGRKTKPVGTARSSASSPGGFGGTQTRDTTGWVAGGPGSAGASLSMVSTPGPGAYNVPERGPGKIAYVPPERRRPSSAFATRTKRSGGYQANKEGTPGPGSYESKRPQSARRTLGGDSAFRNRAEARVGLAEKSSTGSNVGPGSYNPRGGDPRRGTIEERLTQLVSKSPNSPGFNTSQIRVTARDAIGASTEENPGPGTYESKPLISVAATERGGKGKETHAFKSRTQRGNDLADMKHVGDPGQYKPITGDEIAITSTKAFSKAMQAGTDSFMTTQKRPTFVDNFAEGQVDIPGPGEYTYKSAIGVNDPKKQTHSFASKTKRAIAKKEEATPGAGSYDPRYFVGKPGIKGGGGQAAFKSRAARDGSQDRRQEGGIHGDPAVGPATYNVIEQDPRTIRWASGPAMGSSAFKSTTLRDPFPD